MQLYIARYYWEDIRETYGVNPKEATENVTPDGIWEYSQVYQVDGTAYNVKLEKVEG